MGQSRRFGDVRGISGLPPIADVRCEVQQVRKVPTGDIEGLARRSPTEALPSHRRAVVAPRLPAPPQFTGPGWLLVHAQLAASVRIKSAALPTNAGEKNEPTGGVAESIGSLDDLIQLAEGL